MKIDSLPTSYSVPGKLMIGTNRLENVTALVTFNNYVPVLIGEGETPRVWLTIPANSKGTEWYPLVKDNFSTHPDVKVLTSNHNVQISTPDGIVVDAETFEDGSIDVHTLNLRPFGLNIHAEQGKLVIMNSTFSKNRMKNVKVMVGIGGDA